MQKELLETIFNNILKAEIQTCIPNYPVINCSLFMDCDIKNSIH